MGRNSPEQTTCGATRPTIRIRISKRHERHGCRACRLPGSVSHAPCGREQAEGRPRSGPQRSGAREHPVTRMVMRLKGSACWGRGEGVECGSKRFRRKIAGGFSMSDSRCNQKFMTRLDERPKAGLSARPIDEVYPIRQIGFGECCFQVKEPV
jgi:hypothetical protein